ncbi:hypothetical protein L226DRAFT_571303 [Lentinus tigrinus ALCF2SS1-7]|uniref:Uncharacterized protein n=1 Tax=Lentinus tigrinus ALCF2SS1-6 TaxID=1328759 RepID=A0A5C2SKD0_9APHY|nr:hypothetical protein L227DRAFT_573775 [Lentinus tigrinus ALCF2SS1-6]RPD74399.1 hypothetical protein L226DRAFT_571303 [Lentinus tigrinus ALCF2SS1-7]
MSLSRNTRLCFRAVPPRNLPPCAAPKRVRARPLSSQASPPTPSRHAQFYTDYVAGMIPVALLGSAVYIGLRTWQQHLAHERFLEEAQDHVQRLEEEVAILRQELQQTATSSSSTQNTPTETKKRSGWWPW